MVKCNNRLGTIHIIFLTAPYIAQIYELPKIKEILRFTMISIVAHSFCVVPYALIRRSLNFKKKFWIIMPSTAISYVIAVFVAFFGLSDWALPSQIVSQSLLALLLFYKLQNWTPQGYFSLKELNKIFKFSRDILIDSFLGILFKNIYLMIIPFLAPLSTVGLYFFAERLRDVYVSVFLSSIFKVTYPLMSIEKASGKNLVKSYREVLKMVLSISIPLTLTTIVLISPLFELFIDDSWKGAIIFLEILIFGEIFFTLHALAHSSLLVAGKSGVALTVGILKKIIVLLALYVTWNEKFEVIIFGGVIASAISYLIHIWVNNKILGYSIKNQAFDLWQFFFPGILLIIFIIILQQIEFSIEYLLPEIFILIVIFFLLKIFFIQGFIEEWKKLYSLKADSSR